MARYHNDWQTPGPAQAYEPAISAYMTSEGFRQKQYKGQMVWKKGIGLMTYPQYLSIQYNGNSICVEAFIRYPLLPGVYIGELGINGFFAALPKGLLKQRVNTVEQFIIGQWQNSINQQGMAPQQINK